MAGAPGYINYTIYPATAVFTASYSTSPSSNNFTFTNDDCTIVNDHLTYKSARVNVIGTTTITAYNHTYTYETYDGSSNVTVNLPSQNLYAWTCSSPNLTFWTNTDNPTTAAHIFNSNGIDVTTTYIGQQGLNAKTWEFSTASSSSITFHCLGGNGDKGIEYNIPIGGTAEYTGIDYIYNRDTTKDIIVEEPKPENLYAWTDSNITGTPLTVYTNSTTLTEGMTLYDNTGTDTGYQVSKISNDTFELGQHSVNFVIGNRVTNFTLDGITYTTNTTLKLSEGTHSLSITGTYTSLTIQSTGVGKLVFVISGATTSVSYTGSLIISSGNITESTQNYLFGTCPITLTFEGSTTSGGGNN